MKEFERLITMQMKARHGSKRGGSSKDPSPKRRALPTPDHEMICDWFKLCDADGDGCLRPASRLPATTCCAPFSLRYDICMYDSRCHARPSVRTSADISFTEFFAFALREALARALDGHGVLADFLALWDQDLDKALDAVRATRSPISRGAPPIALCHGGPSMDMDTRPRRVSERAGTCHTPTSDHVSHYYTSRGNSSIYMYSTWRSVHAAHVWSRVADRVRKGVCGAGIPDRHGRHPFYVRPQR